MNEKFKLLALEAKMGTADFDAGSYYVATPDRMQLFAELIVRKCMDVLDPGEHQLIARFQARQWLAEHFGVEE